MEKEAFYTESKKNGLNLILEEGRVLAGLKRGDFSAITNLRIDGVVHQERKDVVQVMQQIIRAPRWRALDGKSH